MFTDTHKGYNGLDACYAVKQVNHWPSSRRRGILGSKGEYVSGDVHTNGIETFWSLLKRSIQGSQIHISPEHLQRYVTERAFAYNYRETDDLGRMRAATSGVVGRRLTWDDLTGDVASAGECLPG